MSEIELDVFCDEIKNTSLSRNKRNSIWTYFGLLFVPKSLKDIILYELLRRRCIQHDAWCLDESECPFQCGYHDQNNTEIKYVTLSQRNARYKIAHRWLNDFLIETNNKGNMKLIYFNILGLNLSNMNMKLFGKNHDKDSIVYNRFFRTALKSGVNYFFKGYDNVIIDTIFHDKGNQESNEIFPWHLAYKLNLEDNSKIQIRNKDIIFIDSDHRKESHFSDESHFVQFIDLILGSIYCCLHNPTEKQEKRQMGLIIKPLLERLLSKPWNKNSTYHYYRIQSISFFPKRKTSSLDEIFTQLDIFGDLTNIRPFPRNFYIKRPILLHHEKQKTLLNWMES